MMTLNNINRESLLEPLQMVIGVVERRQTVPILANILLTVEGSQLSMTATDMETELLARSEIISSGKEIVQLTVSGRKLLDIIRTLPEDATINLEEIKDRLVLKFGRSRFSLVTLPVSTFPRFVTDPSLLTFSLTQKALSGLLQRSHFSMAQQDIRLCLNGMLIEIRDNRIYAVAADGHRFAMNSEAIDLPDQSAKAILPRKGVLELLRLLKQSDSEVSVEVGENHLRVCCEDFIFTSRLIEGRFPDYERLLSHDSGVEIVVNRSLFKDALLRVSILSNEKLRVVRLHAEEGYLKLLANNPEQEEAEEALAVQYSGESFEVAFNVGYLLDVLNTLTDEAIKLVFVNQYSSMFMERLEGRDSLFLVMPLQL